MATKIFVVEDHELFRDMLVRSLNRIDGLEVCGSSGSAEDALENLPGTQADLALVDVSLPKMNGFDFVSEIRKRCPEVVCVMLSGYRQRAHVNRARALGAQAYVAKGDYYQLKAALQDVIAGRTYFPDFD